MSNGHYLAGHYTPNFVGLFPAQDPQLVLVVKLDDPQGDYLSGATAAPMVRSILEAALEALYRPLSDMLASDSTGAREGFQFSVRRVPRIEE